MDNPKALAGGHLCQGCLHNGQSKKSKCILAMLGNQDLEHAPGLPCMANMANGGMGAGPTYHHKGNPNALVVGAEQEQEQEQEKEKEQEQEKEQKQSKQ